MNVPVSLIRWLRKLKKHLPVSVPKWVSDFILGNQHLNKTHELQFLYYPVFENTRDYTDHYYRMIWYLNPIIDRIEQITFLYAGEQPALLEIPPYLDPAIRQFAKNIQPKTRHISIQDNQLTQEACTMADVVMLWHTDKDEADYIPKTKLKQLIWGKNIRRVDHQHERYAGSVYLYVSHDIGSLEDETARSREKFEQLVQEVSRDKVYIFGTGPNLQQVADYDFHDGVSIACNSMIKNKELMESLQPPIITMADPIFHAGCSSYAGEFRKYLIDAMDTFGSYLVVPMRDYRVYMHNLPVAYQTRIIGIPYKKRQKPNLDLRAQYDVTTTANIMTLFLLPLACTVGQSIYLAGFDGRPLSENDYFWKHDPKSQISEKMSDIRVAHPAFFAIDYNDYYRQHIDTVDRWLTAANKRGHQIYNLTDSHIPALQRYSVKRKGSSGIKY